MLRAPRSANRRVQIELWLPPFPLLAKGRLAWQPLPYSWLGKSLSQSRGGGSRSLGVEPSLRATRPLAEAIAFAVRKWGKIYL